MVIPITAVSHSQLCSWGVSLGAELSSLFLSLMRLRYFSVFYIFHRGEYCWESGLLSVQQDEQQSSGTGWAVASSLLISLLVSGSVACHRCDLRNLPVFLLQLPGLALHAGTCSTTWVWVIVRADPGRSFDSNVHQSLVFFLWVFLEFLQNLFHLISLAAKALVCCPCCCCCLGHCKTSAQLVVETWSQWGVLCSIVSELISISD